MTDIFNKAVIRASRRKTGLSLVLISAAVIGPVSEVTLNWQITRCLERMTSSLTRLGLGWIDFTNRFVVGADVCSVFDASFAFVSACTGQTRTTGFQRCECADGGGAGAEGQSAEERGYREGIATVRLRHLP